jgi:hypothetical protein
VHGDLAERLFEALLKQDAEAFRNRLEEASVWELPGRSALAGVHQGPEEILAVLRRLAELRPIRDEAYDVMVSQDHAVLTTRLVGNGIDSDHAIVVAAGAEGRLDRAFQYVFDMYAFDAFFGQ